MLVALARSHRYGAIEHSGPRMRVTIVRPLVVTRFANAVPGLTVALLGVFAASELLVGGLAVVAAGVALARA